MKIRNQQNSNPDRPKEIDQILDEQIETGLHEFQRSRRGLFISSFAAGLEIGFSVLLMTTVYTMYHHSVSTDALKLYLALCYPIGFIFVIIGRSELFTEHTALALLPVLNRSVGLKDLLKLWGTVYSGNLLGGFVFAFLLYRIGPEVGFAEVESINYFSNKMTSHSWHLILSSALLAGWMMGLLGWLVTSSQETISRIISIILVTSIIGLAGLHHCIVGSIEVFAGLINDSNISLSDYLHFQFWATLGNAMGGTIFVALLKFGHVKSE